MNPLPVLVALTREPAVRLPEGPPWLGWVCLVLGLLLLALGLFLRWRR